MAKNKRIAILKIFILTALICGIFLFIFLYFRDTLFNLYWLKNLPQYLRRNRKPALFILLGIQILQIIVFIIPGQPIQIAGSYLYGFFRGYLISIAGAIIGSTIVFYFTRILGQSAVYTLFGEKKSEYYRRKINSGKGLTILFYIYLIPGIPKDIVAYVAGISSIDFKKFTLISTIGRSPGMAGSLLLGHFMKSSNYIGIAILSAVTSIILLIIFIKRNKIYSLLEQLEERK